MNAYIQINVSNFFAFEKNYDYYYNCINWKCSSCRLKQHILLATYISMQMRIYAFISYIHVCIRFQKEDASV